MAAQRIFISHSTRDADEIALRDLVAQTVINAQGAVLMDRLTLKSGDLWRREIYSWILLAESAIIVVTRSAFRSKWVPRECVVLAWRRELDPRFRVHIVLAPDIPPARLKDPPFDDLNLNEFNVVQAAADPALAQLAAALTAQQANARTEDTVVGRLEEVLTPIYANLNPNRVSDAEKELRLRLNGWDTQFGPVRRLAAGLAQYGFWRQYQKGVAPGDEIRPGLAALRQLEDRLKGQAGASILGTLAPSWVDAIAAGRLHAALRSPNRRVIALVAQYDETLRHHVARAWSARWSRGPEVDQMEEPAPETTGSRLDSLKAAVFATYRPRLPLNFRNKPPAVTAPIIDKLLKERDRDGVPHIFFVDGNGAPGITLADLTELQAAMPYIACVWITARRQRLPDTCCIIRPMTTPRLETEAMTDYSEAYSILA